MRARASLRRALRRFLRDEDGAGLVEYAMVISLYLLIFFGLIDFGRLAFHYVTAEKAMHVAARIAAVRPPVCAAVPEFNAPGPVAPGALPPDFGTSCNAGTNVCTAAGTISCSGAAGNAVVDEIWPRVRGTLPNDATEANLLFSYAFDPNLGFLGGPYTPVVTVELQNLDFQFVTPLAGLVAATGGTPSARLTNATQLGIPFPPMSVSLPGEDLAAGNNG